MSLNLSYLFCSDEMGLMEFKKSHANCVQASETNRPTEGEFQNNVTLTFWQQNR